MDSPVSLEIPFHNQIKANCVIASFNASLSDQHVSNYSSLFECNQSFFNSNPVSLSSHSPKGKTAVFQGLVLILVTLASMLINLRVICIVVTVPRKRLRHASILAAHFSLVIIFSSFVGILYLAEKANVLKIPGPRACKFVSYLSNTFHSVFSLNIIGINYERIRTFKLTLEKLLVYRTIFYLWIAALLGNIPAIFMVEFVMDPQTSLGKCKQVHLFGDFYATLVYEILRFLVYYGFVVGYMIYALYRIRSKIKYLYILKPIPNERMRRKVHKVRFIYFHSVIFIVVWLPIGFLSLFYKVSSRQPMFSSTPTIYHCLVVVNWIFVTFNPLIHLHMSEDMTYMKWWWFTYQRRRVQKESAKKPTNQSDNLEHAATNLSTTRLAKDSLKSGSGDVETTTGYAFSEISRYSTIDNSPSLNLSLQEFRRSSSSSHEATGAVGGCTTASRHSLLFLEKTCETFI